MCIIMREMMHLNHYESAEGHVTRVVHLTTRPLRDHPGGRPYGGITPSQDRDGLEGTSADGLSKRSYSAVMIR
jgi:hypothetical protein